MLGAEQLFTIHSRCNKSVHYNTCYFTCSIAIIIVIVYVFISEFFVMLMNLSHVVCVLLLFLFVCP